MEDITHGFITFEYFYLTGCSLLNRLSLRRGLFYGNRKEGPAALRKTRPAALVRVGTAWLMPGPHMGVDPAYFLRVGSGHAHVLKCEPTESERSVTNMQKHPTRAVASDANSALAYKFWLARCFRDGSPGGRPLSGGLCQFYEIRREDGWSAAVTLEHRGYFGGTLRVRAH